MKFVTMNFSKKWGMLLLLVFLAGLSIKCSTSEMDFIDPFEFVTEEFDNVPDVVVVEDPEPEVQEVETGEVANLEVAGELTGSIVQVVESEGALELAEETEQIVEKVEETSNAVLSEALGSTDEEVLTEAVESFEEEEAVALLEEETVLTEEQETVLTAVEAAPEAFEEIGALLPAVEETEDFSILEEDEEEFPDDIDFDLELDLELSVKTSASALRSLTLVGPCAESANEAYAVAVARLEQQRDANLATISQNYQRRITEANSRLAERTNAYNAFFSARLSSIRNNVRAIFAAARRVSERGDFRRARQLRYYAFAYSYWARYSLFRFRFRTFETFRRRRILEIREAQASATRLAANVRSNFNQSLVVADANLREALDSCHNQGAGN
ncbi:hypothetical protein [Cyclobacterium xiamenense]|uniref:hypothetical protein n=1 Tax=Cyclobacterium xiamenense TaxID=1297121 RepID=UPI0012B87053|nr:hypothetical protein [Cyclobacterium xiamenense]